MCMWTVKALARMGRLVWAFAARIAGLFCKWAATYDFQVVAFWQMYTKTSLCGLFLSLEIPNDVQSEA